MSHQNPFESLQAATPQVASMRQGHATLKGLGETLPEHLAAQLVGPNAVPHASAQQQGQYST